jgi:peptidoglycan/LPS O-acetylase OafA/YrhL
MARGPGVTLNDVFDPKANSLNALRLAFATAVLVSHSFVLAGGGNEPGVRGLSIAAIAVDGFFVVSGYLITMSRLRSSSLRAYARRRILRIYPGLWVNLLLTAAVIVPLLLWLEDERTSAGSILRYVGVNAVLPRIDDIQGVASDAPFPSVINGSLWTLQWELAGYVVLGLLGSLRLLHRRGFVLTALAILSALAAVQTYAEVGVLDGWYATNGVRFSLLFCAGAAVFLCRDWLPGGVLAAAIAAAILAASLLVLPSYRFVGAVPAAYLCIWLGARLPLADFGVAAGRRQADDLSYGVYVYAFPLQQLVWAILGPGANPLVFIGLSAAMTFPVAFASWRLVEAPAMRAGARLGRRRVAQREPAV